MKKYKVGVVGIGLVGSEMVKVLKERKFPTESLRIFATRERLEEISGEKYSVEVAKDDSFNDLDIVFFAGTEGEKGASKQFGWKAVEQGAYVIDNGDDYRMDPKVPLVIPEVNPHHLDKNKKFISNPNCSTIQMVIVLAPLHKYAKIKRVVATTYQSVSGTGRSAIQELSQQIKDISENKEPQVSVYPHRIAFNVIPQISNLTEEFPGYFKEEIKMIKETRKILDEQDLKITATCARVPVYIGHSVAINVQFEKEISVSKAKEILNIAPGIKVIDEPEKSVYPLPSLCAGKDDVFVGRIREDPTLANTLDMWVVSDNIRKGAALNAVQIAEKLIEKKFL